MGNTRKRNRKYSVTINNPLEHSFSHEEIKSILVQPEPLYWCMCDEIGQNGTYHTHVFLAYENAIEFKTIQNLFNNVAHIESSKGTAMENRDYCRKEGKYLDSDKKETNLIETFEEFGDINLVSQGKRNDISQSIEMIQNGADVLEVINEIPSALKYMSSLEKYQNQYNSEKYKNTFRQLEVTYMFGLPGSGKTRYVYDKFGYDDVYRVTDYLHPFDSYKGQDVIVFDEYRFQFSTSQILDYLDGYPLELPCRYSNKAACYTKVFIISNLPYKEFISGYDKDTEAAIRRRINHVFNWYKENDYVEEAT